MDKYSLLIMMTMGGIIWGFLGIAWGFKKIRLALVKGKIPRDVFYSLANFLGGLSALSVLVGVLILGFQFILWLRNGEWVPFSLLSGLALCFEGVRSWAYQPKTWFGLHKFLHEIPCSLLFILVPSLFMKVVVSLRDDLEKSLFT